MTDAGAANVDQSSTPERDAIDGTAAAVESFVGRNTLRGRYLLVALALAVVWWLVIGPMSAWVAGIGLVALTPGLQGVVRAVLSRRWPETEGVVLSSEVLTEPEAREYAGLGATMEVAADTQQFSGGYVPLVRYEFTVDGRRCVNAVISPFDGSLSRRHWAKTLVEQYPENNRVSLRYDPDDPTRSYLRPWIRSTSGIIPVAGIAMLIAAVWFALGMPGRAARLRTPHHRLRTLAVRHGPPQPPLADDDRNRDGDRRGCPRRRRTRGRAGLRPRPTVRVHHRRDVLREHPLRPGGG
jgi:hypothetical protein